MKHRISRKNRLSLLLALCLIVALFSAAFADEGADASDDSVTVAEEATAAVPEEMGTAAEEEEEPDLWEAELLEMLALYEADPSTIAAGYCNLVTGETHFYNGDTYMVSGSMYKIPLNMLFLDWIDEGELTMESNILGYPYSTLLDGTIIHSDNDMARVLWTYAGNTITTDPASTPYHRYRILIADYMGEDADTVADKYYENNFFTPRQVITCLQHVYENSEKYASLIEDMQRAEPTNYFKLRERRFNIAHKYGYYIDNTETLYLNDCAICYTDEPIAIVLFTAGTVKPYNVLTEYCSLMCNYTQETIAARAAREETEAAAAAAAAEEEEARQEALAAQEETEADVEDPAAASPSDPVTASPEPAVKNSHSLRVGPLIALVLTLILMLLSICLVVSASRRSRLRRFHGIAAVLLGTTAILLCIYAASGNTIYTRASGDPQETIVLFTESLKNGDYQTADSLLLKGASLGLNRTPDSEEEALLLAALKASWDFAPYGECTITQRSAWQQMRVQHLSLTALDAALQERSKEVLSGLVRSLPMTEVYDENGEYLPSLAETAYREALRDVISHAEDYYTYTGITLELRESNGTWLIVPDERLISVLSGN